MLRPHNCSALALALLGVGAILVGCSNSSETARVQREARAQARAGAKLATDRLTAAGAAADDLVAAVSTAEGQTPVSLRFKLAEQPRVGQPLSVQLALAQTAGLEIDAIHVSLLPREGLDVRPPRTFDFDAPATGATQQMQVTVVPSQPGVLGLGVTVLVDSSANSVARSFTIPLIAIAPAL
jgi:hypothetical protein